MSMRPVGYLTNRPDGLYGERGSFYDYIVAGNGVFIDAESRLMAARVPVADCEIRGLAPIDTKVSLTYGSIPQRFFDLALDLFLSDTSSEHYVAIVGDAGYHFYIPVQDKSEGGVVYELGTSVVMDLHSHGDMPACFSPTDNKDEQGLRLYGVVGKLEGRPEVRLRVGVYGYFHPISWSQVFDGSLVGVDDLLVKDLEVHDSEEEVKSGDRLLNRVYRFFGRDT